MPEAVEHLGRLTDARAGHAAEPDVDERGTRPLGDQSSGLVGVRVGVGIRRAAGDHQQRETGPSRGDHRLAEHLDRRPRHPDRPPERERHMRLAPAGVDDHSWHVALGVAGIKQHQGQHNHPAAAPGHQPVGAGLPPAVRSSPETRLRPPRQGRAAGHPGRQDADLLPAADALRAVGDQQQALAVGAAVVDAGARRATDRIGMP